MRNGMIIIDADGHALDQESMYRQRYPAAHIDTSSQLHHCTPVLVLHVLRDGQEDLLTQRVQQPFLHKVTVRR